MMEDSTDKAIKKAIFDMTMKAEKLKQKQKKKMKLNYLDTNCKDSFQKTLQETTDSRIMRAPISERTDGRRDSVSEKSEKEREIVKLSLKNLRKEEQLENHF